MNRPVERAEVYKVAKKTARGMSSLLRERLRLTKVAKVDDQKFITYYLCRRMVLHAVSLVRLGSSLDCDLVTRSIFEGLVNLFYAMKAKEQRFADWRYYAFVRDWNIAKRNEDLKSQRYLERKLRDVGRLEYFLEKKGRKALRANDPLPERAFCDNWRRKSLHATVIEMRDFPRDGTLDRNDGSILKSMYDLVYNSTCEWAHWDIAGLALLTSEDDVTAMSQSSALKRSEGAMIAAVHGLSHFAEWSSLLFGWPIREKIIIRRDAFCEALLPLNEFGSAL